MRATNRGFTLVELMVSLVIIGLVAAVALSRMTKSNEITALQQADADVRASVNNARRRAINRGQDFCLDVTAESVSYRCRTSSAGCADSTGTTCIDGGAFEAGVVRMWPNEVVALYYAKVADLGTGIEKHPFAGTTPFTVTFKPDGSVDSDPESAGLQGFTIYFRGFSGTTLKRKVWVVAASGVPGSSDQWE